MREYATIAQDRVHPVCDVDPKIHTRYAWAPAPFGLGRDGKLMHGVLGRRVDLHERVTAITV